MKEQSATLVSLAGLDASLLKVSQSAGKKTEQDAVLVVGPVEIRLPLAGMADPEAERTRLSKEFEDSQSQISRLERLLASDFAQRAPEPVVEKERQKLAALRGNRGQVAIPTR